MTAEPARGSTRYGVVTCGKQAPEPLDLGPCRLEPEHPGDCRWPGLGGYVSIKSEPYTLDKDPVILRYRRYVRRSFYIAAGAAVVNVAAAVWTIVGILTR